jgi:hypothetical protein
MLKLLKGAAIAAAITTAGVMATPAEAGVTICQSPGCVQPDGNVLFQQSTVGNPIFAVLNENRQQQVKFEGDERLVGTQSQGQARISAEDGGLNFLRILLEPSTMAFNEIEFNLNAAGDGSAFIQFFSVAGVLLGGGDFDIKGGGQNFFAAFNDVIGRAEITVTGTSLIDVRQVRLTAATAAAPVPEPGTWALMLFGFGAIGYGLRRRRRSSTALLQLA